MKTRFGRIILDLLVSAAILPVAPFAAAQNVPPDPNFLSVVVIEASDPEAAETGRDTGTFTVRRTAPTNLTLHVTYQTGGTASPGSDYESLPGLVTIPAGAWAATITVTPIDDNLVEGPETVIVRLSQSPVAGLEFSYRIGSPSNAVVTIADNDGAGDTNHPPVVRLVSPQNGASFSAPANILLIAQAIDMDGHVSTVEFFAGTNFIALTTNFPTLNPIGPFVFPWTNVPAGEYTLTAKATDYQGAMSVSDPVRIRVNGVNAQPVVNIFTTDEHGSEIPVVPPGQERPQLFDPAVFTVTRTGGTDLPLDVFYSVSGTASNGVDYERLPGRVTIPAGASSAEIQVAVIDDFLVEGTESVIITIEPPICIAIFPPPPDCYLVGPSNRATAFIHDDDVVIVPLPVVTIVATDPDASETGEVAGVPFQVLPVPAPDPGVFTVTRSGDTNEPLFVFYTVEGTAFNGIDYLALPGIVIIPAGASSATITVVPMNDAFVEGPETVVVQLFSAFIRLEANGGVLPGGPIPPIFFPTPYVAGFPSNAVVTIHDNDVEPPPIPHVTVVATDADASEEGPDPGTFTVTRTGSLSDALGVFYSVGGTAENGVDYEMLPGSVLIPAGSASATITVIPVDDAKFELPETVRIEIAVPAVPFGIPAPPPSYLPGIPNSAVITIRDNDPRPTNSPPSVRIISPPDGAVFRAPAIIPIFAEARDLDGLVTTVEFFEGTNSLGVATNHPMEVSPANSLVNPFHLLWTGVAAGHYTLTAKATDNEGGMALSTAVHITVTETNPPPPPTNQPVVVTIVASDALAAERCQGTNVNTATFKVRRSDGTNTALVVYYTISGTASNGIDYETLPGSVLIPAGSRTARITVSPIDDNMAEAIETVILTLQLPPTSPGANLPVPYSIGAPGRAAAILIDDDSLRPLCLRLPDHSFHFCQPAANLFNYRLEVSVDLVNWIPLCANVVTEGEIRFVDPDASAFPHRFLRAVPEPNPPED
jgi:hypothetical protein